MKGVYIKLPPELIDLLDALAPAVGEIPPAKQGRTSVLLWLANGNQPWHLKNDPEWADIEPKWSEYLQMRGNPRR